MTIDPKKWEKIRKEAREKTNTELAFRISSICTLTVDEIREIAPKPADKEKLAELMKIVSDASKSNKAKADAIRSITGMAEIAVTLIVKRI